MVHQRLVTMDNLVDLSSVKQVRKKTLLEKDIEQPVCRYARNCHKMKVEKFTSPSRRSVPDQLFTNRYGFMFFIEFKAPGKEPTPSQRKDHEDRRKRGVKVFVVDNVEEGKKIVDTMATIDPYIFLLG